MEDFARNGRFFKHNFVSKKIVFKKWKTLQGMEDFLNTTLFPKKFFSLKLMADFKG